MENQNNQTIKKETFYLCHCCMQGIGVDMDHLDHDLTCDRCGHKNKLAKKNSIQATLALSIAALLLFIPANIYPFMTMELYGQTNSATIWGGVTSLMDDGAYFIAVVVFLASLVIPLLKLVILFYLSLTATNGKHTLFKTKLYYFVELIGRWSMLDIFLLAVFVAVIKLGKWTTVEPELGALLFLIVVILTMIAANYFDPRILWQKESLSGNCKSSKIDQD